MSFRVTDAATSANLASYISKNRQLIGVAQEQLSSGKRINRPSDDPVGAGAVLRLRTSQAQLEQFRSTASNVKDNLLIADNALESYEQVLDRAKTLFTQGGSDSTSASGRASIAAELDGLRAQFMTVANMRSNDQFVFGGTRQNVPPFDPTTEALAATATSAPLVQIEPDTAPVTAGVTADTVFSDATGTIFQTLTDVAAALRGTGNAAADKTTILTGLDRLGSFSDLAQVARVRIGSSISTATAADDRMNQTFLSLGESADSVEGADFVKTALELTNAQNALNASLQASSYAGRKSLIDFLG
jgi:flagellar hook-associated protein 3 FlgL